MYAVEIREFGRGKPNKHRFTDLKAAQAFCKEHLEGDDYIDNSESFHSDVATFDLIGFTLRDIGCFRVDRSWGFVVFSWADLDNPDPILNEPEPEPELATTTEEELPF